MRQPYIRACVCGVGLVPWALLLTVFPLMCIPPAGLVGCQGWEERLAEGRARVFVARTAAERKVGFQRGF